MKHHHYYCVLEDDVIFFPPATRYVFFLPLVFSILMMICLCGFLCVYLGFTYLLGYWIDVFRFCRFLTSIFSNIPSALFFLSSPCKTPVACMWVLSHGSLMICSIALSLCFSLGFFCYCFVLIYSSHFLLYPVSLSLIKSIW